MNAQHALLHPMPPLPDASPSTRRGSGPAPLRRRPVAPPPVSVFRRKPFQLLLAFVTAVLLMDALIGDRGLMERLRAGRQYREAETALERLRLENARLREEARRLKEDPGAIESLARKDLGLLRPGEVLFIIRDIKPSR
jgi:cell division protein FtsB